MDKNVKTALIIGGVIIAILIILSVVFGLTSGWQYGGWGMMGPGTMGGFGWGWLMPIFMILFWGLIIWAIVALVRGLTQHDGSKSAGERGDSALEILKSRYAKGEISKEEYEEKKKDLI